MKRVQSSEGLETQAAQAFLAQELQRLSDEAATRDEGEEPGPGHRPSVQPDLQRALDATWERSEAVYRRLLDEQP